MSKKLRRNERPMVFANFAMTWDGKISTRNRTPALFTGPADKRRLLEIRSRADALLVGRGTVVADTMSMTLPADDLIAERRARGLPNHPLRVVVSNSGRLPATLKLFSTGETPVVVYVGSEIPPRYRRSLEQVAELRVSDSPEVDLRILLRDMKTRGMKKLLCEGGSGLFRSLAGNDWVDQLYLTLSPKLFGGADAPTLTSTGREFFPSTTRWHLAECEVVEEEAFLRWDRVRR